MSYTTALDFQPPLADAKEFPTPVVRIAPRVKRRPALGKRSAFPSPDMTLMVDRARTGLFLIARGLDIGRVWLPTYHCPAMIAPFLAAGCQVAFYPVDELLSPEVEFLRGSVRENDAVVGVRYFGFESPIDAVADICAWNSAFFIEDLAHATYFGHLRGRVGVTSVHKFLPVSRGAHIIVEDDEELERKIRAVHTQLPTPPRRELASLIARVLEKMGFKSRRREATAYFNLDDLEQGLTAETERVLRDEDHERVCRQRRKNYSYLLQALDDNENGVPLFPALSETTVPYVLPFLLHDHSAFDELRKRGIQALRWEEMVKLACTVTEHYRTNLVQLPIHQDLTEAQLERIVSSLQF